MLQVRLFPRRSSNSPYCSVGGWEALGAELEKDIRRISYRNLGRDDRCISDHQREARFPYLDEQVVHYLNSLPLNRKVSYLPYSSTTVAHYIVGGHDVTEGLRRKEVTTRGVKIAGLPQSSRLTKTGHTVWLSHCQGNGNWWWPRQGNRCVQKSDSFY